MAELPSGTVTFLFTDIEGSTRLLQQLGDSYGDLLEAQRRILREAAAAREGREVDTQGDSFFFAFARANAAVGAAVVAQRALAEHEWPEGASVRVRMGLHTGEPAVGDERYVGLGVHRAARIGAVAHGGQVLLSSATRELVEDAVGDVTVRELGTYRLKDLDRPERLYQLDIGGLQTAFPPLRAEKVAASHPWRRALLLAGVLVLAAVAALLVLEHGSGGPHASASIVANAVAAIDATRGRPVGATSLAAAPGSIAYGERSVWVAMPAEDSVVRIDSATNTIEQTIPVGNGPAAIAVGGGFVWVANSLAGSVSQIDPRKNGGQEVARIMVGNGPTGIVYGLGRVWVANAVDRTVLSINPVTNGKSAAVSVEAGADAIAVGDRALWVTGKAAGVVSRVDPRVSGAVQPINVGTSPVAVAFGAGSVWVANRGDATVSRVSPVTNHVVGTIQVGEGPSGLTVAPAGKFIWVSSELGGTLSKIEPGAGLAKTITVGGLPQGVAASASTAYVAVKSTGAAHRGGTLTLVVPNPQGVYYAALPKSVDPANGYTAWELLSLTNDGLVGYSREGGAESYRIVADLAASLPSVTDGGRTYTFTVRPGIHYSNGASVRPQDFARGIERSLVTSGAKGPADLSRIVGAAACIKRPKSCDLSRGVVANPEFNTVTFHLAAPDPDFLAKLAMPVADAVPASTPLKAKLPLPATGPYEFGGWDAKRGTVRLVRNPRFHLWSAAAQPDGFPNQIVERFGYSGASAVRAVERGTADVTAPGFDLNWPPAIAASLRTRYSSRVYSVPLPAPVGVWLNTRVAPFDDVRVRQALNYAVDRNHLIDLAGGPLVAQVGCQFLPPDTEGYQRNCPYTRRPNRAGTYTGPDLARAQRLVAASGTRGQPVTVFFYQHVPIGLRNGKYFVSVLQRLGYKAKLRLVPHPLSTWRLGRQAGVGGWAGGSPSANSFLSTLTCHAYETADPNANTNPAGFCDRRIDQEIDRANTLQATDPTAAARLWTTIDRRLTAAAPWVTIRLPQNPDFVGDRIGNWTYCYLPALTGSTGACLDRLWVR